MTYAQKIDVLLADLATLVTSLNLLGRYAEASNVQHAIEDVHSVSREGTLRAQPWPIKDGLAASDIAEDAP